MPDTNEVTLKSVKNKWNRGKREGEGVKEIFLSWIAIAE